MRNIVEVAGVVSVISIFLLFCLQFFISVHLPSFKKSGRIALFWSAIYILFLFSLRLFQFTNLATADQLRVLAGFSSLIPLLAVVIHLWFYNKLEDLTPPIDLTDEPIYKEIKVAIKAKK